MHIEQVLINLIKNALEAITVSATAVEISCRRLLRSVEFMVIDQGTGISNAANLFVTFFKTKDKGA